MTWVIAFSFRPLPNGEIEISGIEDNPTYHADLGGAIGPGEAIHNLTYEEMKEAGYGLAANRDGKTVQIVLSGKTEEEYKRAFREELTRSLAAMPKEPLPPEDE